MLTFRIFHKNQSVASFPCLAWLLKPCPFRPLWGQGLPLTIVITFQEIDASQTGRSAPDQGGVHYFYIINQHSRHSVLKGLNADQIHLAWGLRIVRHALEVNLSILSAICNKIQPPATSVLGCNKSKHFSKIYQNIFKRFF